MGFVSANLINRSPFYAPARKRRKKELDHSDELWGQMSVWEKIKWWWARQREADNIGKFLILVIYTIMNVWIGIDTYVEWEGTVIALNNIGEPAPSHWAPFAKTAGMLLNINCAILLVTTHGASWLFMRLLNPIAAAAASP